jgi:hypothetical protein
MEATATSADLRRERFEYDAAPLTGALDPGDALHQKDTISPTWRKSSDA